jgi:hypothetical protein
MDQTIDTTQATQANQDQVFDFEFDDFVALGFK